MGDISVPDGTEYADLGVNFRAITSTIHTCIDPHSAEIVADYTALRERVAGMIEGELTASLFAPRPEPRGAQPRGLLERLGLRRQQAGPPERIEDKERRILADWQRLAAASADPLQRCILQTLG